MSGAFIGFVGLGHQDEWTEGGWRLGSAYWGEGFATEGAVASVRYGLEELGLERVISIIQPENAAACRVAEKAGLTLQGKTYWRGNEVVWYAVDRDSWEAKKLTG